MENASKALVMAGSILISLIVIGALILVFNNLTSYQNAGIQDTREAQVIQFNNQFETYIRDNVRGSDMVSLINRVVDYNKRKGDNSDEQYEEMKITITGINVDKLKYEKSNKPIIKSSYTENDLDELLAKVEPLENKYQSKYITTLSSSINKVMKSEEETQKLLPKKLSAYTGGYEQIKEDTASYYQYSQFKRVYFNCDDNEVKYNSKTGRIIYMKFTCTNKLE